MERIARSRGRGERQAERQTARTRQDPPGPDQTRPNKQGRSRQPGHWVDRQRISISL